MDLSTFVIIVYCEVDDWLKDKQLRQRGPDPTLSDSEVLTMELVGESPKAWATIPTRVSIATFVGSGATGSRA